MDWITKLLFKINRIPCSIRKGKGQNDLKFMNFSFIQFY